MKEQPQAQVKNNQHSNSEHKMKRLQIPQNSKSCIRKILGTRNCRLKFIKHFLPENHKENRSTKQPPFKSRMN